MPFCAFAQFAEPMTADAANLRELTRPLSAFATFQHGLFCHLHGFQFFIEKVNILRRIGSGLRDPFTVRI
jgi:hypothetical protein